MMRILSDLSRRGSFSAELSSISCNQLSMDALQTGFSQQATDLSFLTAMTAGSGAFALGRTLGTALFSHGLGAVSLNAAAWSFGFLCEVTAFRGVNQILNPAAEHCFEAASFTATAADFLMLKGAGTLLRNNSYLLRQMGQASAMLAGESVGEQLGLREANRQDFSAKFVNALVTGFAMEMGSHASHIASGGRVEAVQRNLAERVQRENLSAQTLQRRRVGRASLGIMSASELPNPQLGREAFAARIRQQHARDYEEVARLFSFEALRAFSGTKNEAILRVTLDERTQMRAHLRVSLDENHCLRLRPIDRMRAEKLLLEPMCAHLRGRLQAIIDLSDTRLNALQSPMLASVAYRAETPPDARRAEILRELSESPSAKPNVLIAELIELGIPDHAREILEKVFSQDKERGRAVNSALAALIQLAHADSRPLFERLLKSQSLDYQGRLLVIEVLGMMGNVASIPVLSELAAAVAERNEGPLELVETGLALARLGNAQGKKILTKELLEGNENAARAFALLGDPADLPLLRKTLAKFQSSRGANEVTWGDYVSSILLAPLLIPISSLIGKTYSISTQARGLQRLRAETRMGMLTNLLNSLAYMGDFSSRPWLEKTIRETSDCAEVMGLMPALAFQGEPQAAQDLVREVMGRFFAGQYKHYAMRINPYYNPGVFPWIMRALGNTRAIDEMKANRGTWLQSLGEIKDEGLRDLLLVYHQYLDSLLDRGNF